VKAAEPNQIWQSDMTKIWARPAAGWACLVSVIDRCTREIVGWNLSYRCRTEDALAAVEQAILARLPEGRRAANVTLTTDNGTRFTSSRFLETLGRLGITHRRTAYHHPEGNSDIERFHRKLKEQEPWTAHRHMQLTLNRFISSTFSFGYNRTATRALYWQGSMRGKDYTKCIIAGLNRLSYLSPLGCLAWDR
jgi:putative transposase